MSIIQLSQSALQRNISFLQGQFKNTKISSVVKANAYGHGLKEFVSMTYECGIKHYSVFSSSEARRIREYIPSDAEIMIMGWIAEKHVEWIVKNRIDFFVFDFQRLDEFLEVAKQLNIPLNIHIELETGMNRTGFAQNDIKELIQILNRNRNFITLKGLCTHYAGADSIANYYRIQEQIRVFNTVYKRFKRNGLKPEARHTACSAAAISYPRTRYEMVRIGIMQYGFWPSKETLIQFMTKYNLQEDPLDRILRWKAEILSVKNVRKGEFISYGTSYLAQKDMKIAIVPVGYSHGYSRNLSNQGRVLIHGQRVGVVGMVNMNLLIADVTTLEDVKIGDEVVMIGKQGDLSITVASFSEFSDQLNYELLTRLPAEIKRVITK